MIFDYIVLYKYDYSKKLDKSSLGQPCSKVAHARPIACSEIPCIFQLYLFPTPFFPLFPVLQFAVFPLLPYLVN